MKKKNLFVPVLLCSAMMLAACGKEEKPDAASPDSQGDGGKAFPLFPHHQGAGILACGGVFPREPCYCLFGTGASLAHVHLYGVPFAGGGFYGL